MGVIVKEKEAPDVNSRRHDSQPAVKPRGHIALCRHHRGDFDAIRKQAQSNKENDVSCDGSWVDVAADTVDDEPFFKKQKRDEAEVPILFPVICLPFGGSTKTQLDSTAIPISSQELRSMTIHLFMQRVTERMPAWTNLVGLGFRGTKSANIENITHNDVFEVRLQNWKSSNSFVIFKAIPAQEAVPAPRNLAAARRTLVATKEINENETEMQLRRQICNVCTIDEKHRAGCFVLPDSRHMLLSPDHIRQWVAYLRDPEETEVTLSNPPNIPIFDSKFAVTISKPPAYSHAFHTPNGPAAAAPPLPQDPTQGQASESQAPNPVSTPKPEVRKSINANIALEKSISGNLSFKSHPDPLFVGPEDTITSLLEIVNFPFDLFQDFTMTGFVGGVQVGLNAKLLSLFGTDKDLSIRVRVSDKRGSFFEDYE
ncbi:hypothetical protein BDR26DRAFT_927161 [Obelidium mucronatum]|nr:hypothetical protein BDR26DRAFT_927161 [Obelidium mucronatum]